MADNITIAGATLASDEVGGNHHQRIKPTWGVDGIANDTNLTTPMPVEAVGETGVLSKQGTNLTVQYATISCATGAANDIVAATAGQVIRVLSLSLFATGTANTVYFHDDTPTALLADGTRPIPLDKTGAAGAAGVVLGFNPHGWFQTGTGKKLQLTLSAAQGVAGCISYVKYTA